MIRQCKGTKQWKVPAIACFVLPWFLVPPTRWIPVTCRKCDSMHTCSVEWNCKTKPANPNPEWDQRWKRTENFQTPLAQLFFNVWQLSPRSQTFWSQFSFWTQDSSIFQCNCQYSSQQNCFLQFISLSALGVSDNNLRLPVQQCTGKHGTIEETMRRFTENLGCVWVPKAQSLTCFQPIFLGVYHTV